MNYGVRERWNFITPIALIIRRQLSFECFVLECGSLTPLSLDWFVAARVTRRLLVSISTLDCKRMKSGIKPPHSK
jgi:hypothetical protein